MLVDVLSIALKSLAYVALLQAAGGALYLSTFAAQLPASARLVERFVGAAAAIGVVLSLLHAVVEAARMSGDWSGIREVSLQRRVWLSSLGASTTLRVLALAVLATRGGRRIPAVAAALAVLSLLLIGHTSVHPARWILAPLLAFHLLVAAWWYGSLLPLALAASREESSVSQRLVDRFSAIAVWLVPSLALTGLLVGSVLTHGRYSPRDPYDLALTGKAFGFALALGLAALNRWRLGPALSTGALRARRAFRVSLGVEFLVITGVVALTAAMTNLYSPAGD